MIEFMIMTEAQKKEIPNNIIGVTHEPLKNIPGHEDIMFSCYPFVKIIKELPEFSDDNSKFFAHIGDDTTGDGTRSHPYKTPNKAAIECNDEVHLYAVCLDSHSYDIDEPIIPFACKGFFCIPGESCTFQTLSSEIPSGFIKSLPSIEVSAMLENNYEAENVLIASGNIAYDLTGYENNYSWTPQTPPLTGNILKLKRLKFGAYGEDIFIITDGGMIYRYYAKTSPFSNANYVFKDIIEYNRYLFTIAWDKVALKNVLLRSADGQIFTVQDTNLDDPEFENEMVQSLNIWKNKIILTTVNNICLSEDGLNYKVIKAFSYNSSLFKTTVYKDVLYLLFEGLGVFKATTIENFTVTKVLSIAPEQTAGSYYQSWNPHHLYITDTSGNLYRSTNGDTFVKVKSSIGKVIGFFDGQLYADCKRIDAFMINYFYYPNFNSFDIFNITFKTNVLDYVISNPVAIVCNNIVSSGFIISFNERCWFTAFYDSKFYDQYHGVQSCVVAENSIFFRINGIAINNSGSNMFSGVIINHCTFFNISIGIYLSEIIDFEFKNSIIYFAHQYGIYNETATNELNIENNIISRSPLRNVKSLSCFDVNPLFISDNNDFHIRTKEKGYLLESPAKEAGNDNLDIGAYSMKRLIVSNPVPIIIKPVSQPSKIEQDIFKPFFQSDVNIVGEKVISGLPERKRILLEWDATRFVPDIDRLMILLKNKTLYFSNDDTYYSGTGIVSVEKISSEIAHFALSEVGDTFKVYRDDTAKLTFNELFGYQLQAGLISSRILFNTETEIYFSADSEIPEGVNYVKVKYIKVILSNENIKTSRITTKTKLRSGFTLQLDEVG